MILDRTAASFCSFTSNLMTLIKGVKLVKGKPWLEFAQAANTRKILLNLSSVRTIIDRLIQRSTEPTRLRDMRNKIGILMTQVLKPDNAKFNKKAETFEEWNEAEKILIEISEKFVLELERQLSTVIDMPVLERYTSVVSCAVLNRKQLTIELSTFFGECLKKENPDVKIPDPLSSELNIYLNGLLIKYSTFYPIVLHTGDYPFEVKWEYSSGYESITAILSNSLGISLEFEVRWQDSNDLAKIVHEESISVKKNHYKCLCLVNTAWDRKNRNFARRFSYPKLALYLYELRGGLYYNKKDTAVKHYEFWFKSEMIYQPVGK
jgi:hypothetical protein